MIVHITGISAPYPLASSQGARGHAPRRAPLLNLLLILACVLVASCTSEEPRTETQLGITIVHGPELRPHMSLLRERFLATDARIPDGENGGRGTKITVELISEMGMNAAERIARGDIKPAGWISNSSSLVNYENLQVKNLGARQGDCIPLFGTPLVIAALRERTKELGARGNILSWNELFEGLLAEHPAENEALIALNHTTPRHATSGIGALLQLAYLASHGGTAALSMDALSSSSFVDRLRSYESVASGYGLSEAFLLQRATQPETKRTRVVVTTEQQLAVFNRDQLLKSPPEALSPLVALYPQEGSVWEDYQFCFSQSDWVTPPQRAATQRFSQFLSSVDAQLEAKKLGFRPSEIGLPEVVPLTPRFGVDVRQPSTSFLPVSGQVLERLMAMWPEVMRPSSLVLVLDSSGSMEGDSHRLAREQFRNLLARSTKRDLKALISFTNRPKLESDFTSNSAQVMTKLDDIQSLGGSAIYDAIRTSVELLISRDLREYRKAIILITDGDDKNSDLSRQGIIDLVTDKFSRNDITLIIVALNASTSDFSDLEAIARAANGSFRITPPADLPLVFEELVGSMQGLLER